MVTPDGARKLAAAFDEAGKFGPANVLRDLASQVEALKADAERYRFIQNTVDFSACRWGKVRSYDGPWEDGWEALTDEEVDAAIDAAMKK